MIDAFQARVRGGGSRGIALLRLRPPGPQSAGADADHRQAGGRPAHRRRHPAPARGGPPRRADPGFFDIPVDHLFAAPPVIIDYLAKKDLKDPVLVSPTREAWSARGLSPSGSGGPGHHRQAARGQQRGVFMHLIGDVKDKDVVIADDMIDTAGTLIRRWTRFRREGARRILACAVHGVLSGPAIARIKESILEEVIITNTVPLTPSGSCPRSAFSLRSPRCSRRRSVASTTRSRSQTLFV